MTAARVLIVLTTAILPARALAWDYPGHRIVGAIADIVLEKDHPAAYARVMALLARTAPDGTVVRRPLREVAVFADCAKKNNEPLCGRPPSGEERDYAARNRHHDRFHYTDVPLPQDAYREGGAGTGPTDVVHMIDYAVAQLRARTADGKPQKIAGEVDLTDTEAVWLLAHLVGDIHQPLHVGAAYYDATCAASVDPSGGDPATNFGIGTTVAETVGGNLIYLAADDPAAAPPAANLHYYWDGVAVARAMRTAGLSEAEFARRLAETLPPDRPAGAPATWAEQWAADIMPLAREAHARLAIRKGDKPSPFATSGGCTWTATLDPAYEDWAAARASGQLAKAGLRLAALLAAIFE